jgi:hypothetical protein
VEEVAVCKAVLAELVDQVAEEPQALVPLMVVQVQQDKVIMVQMVEVLERLVVEVVVLVELVEILRAEVELQTLLLVHQLHMLLEAQVQVGVAEVVQTELQILAMVEAVVGIKTLQVMEVQVLLLYQYLP